ncbi:unnamed protein product [Parascedosporium putredinis]|uniref:Cytochrome c oxidase assembly protein COX20, mitochondrial n=1 Tax=Parascedosporium putredinis TaxID=1442378 RepID=A0A9P1M900_9PEZI|nr:unnamed protein product [Parascedosporium putredinis]CAI7994789.1 unnamed protein product [Parascedosporium putredinis]
MSSDPAGGDRQPDANPSGGNKRLHIWGRPIEAPADVTRRHPGEQQYNDFQSNFPEQGVSIGDAVKTIKPEDILQVHRSACGRQGLMMGITAGAITGGLRFVWRGTPIKAANWAVGGFLGGAILGFERCQYLRRLERISMKRIVEVHQSDIVEKRRTKEEEDAQKQLQAAAATAKKWYKFW